jgi:hypothetical protein
MRRVGLALVAALIATGVAAGAQAPTATKPPSSLRAGEVWRVTIRPPQPATTRFEIRQGATARSFALRRSRASVTFPRPGSWTYGLRARTRFRKLGAAVVRQRRLVLAEPFDTVEVGDWIVVTDRRAGAVYRLHRTTGTWSRAASVVEARELEPAGAGAVLVTSLERVLRLDVASGSTTEVARAGDVILGLAVAGESLYASEGRAIVRLQSGRREVVTDGLNGVHGLLLRGDRVLAAETFAGRVLAVDPDRGGVTTLARGLANPSSLAIADGGGLYVSEFTGGRLSLLAADGSVRRVAVVPQAGALWRAADGTVLVTTLGGDVRRVDPSTGRSRSVLD